MNKSSRTFVLTTVDDPIFGDTFDDTFTFDVDFLDLDIATIEHLFGAAETTTAP
jgi:hypothetical protein